MTFKIDIQPAGLHFQVERDQAILPAAIAAGIGLPYGCRDGACGSCKSRLVSGRVVHGPHQLKALSVDEEQAGLILTCCATPQTDCVIESRSVAGAGEFPITKMPVRVATLTKAAPDVMVMRLQLPANASFQYKAGQYVEFLLRDGKRRAYSMANAPHLKGEPPQIELHIRHMPGGVFTDALFSTVKEKDIMRVEGPYGSFWLREEVLKPIVLLASGTGFAPIKALIEHLQLKQADRPTVLYWGCRQARDLYLHEWAQQVAAQMPHLRYVPVLSEPDADWRGRTGFVHQAVMADLPDLSEHEVYACGAPVMVEAARRDFIAQCGLPPESFYADSFTSEADKA
ncbi:MAG: CDP-6-deoxy-delta-3,4-glucoseen reductase [Betaproteobacteria bacterium]|nr:CDP-6-deoxy-delta-3,4-glucoseen reductase [Betaproteobacteria bacterium]NBT11368.1 CDP-6-deoxy-delta-3,4-glucoseen reductase [Betaproteobacteria bacterium]NBU49997.1 CDP-6-deoxy-delta-3,4-glucoseen reductase [Betaproteobacteria bacterium]NBX96741.1 CDP-6-deoxy-delta-3,4-glucoseen reductase [Betaproteobacteria bacterium]